MGIGQRLLEWAKGWLKHDLLADEGRQRLETHGIMMCLSEERPSILAFNLAAASETKQKFQASAVHADGAIEISNDMLSLSWPCQQHASFTRDDKKAYPEHAKQNNCHQGSILLHQLLILQCAVHFL